MDDTINMDKVGRLVLPKSIRQKLHIQGPAVFRSQVVANRIELALVEEDSRLLAKKGGLLVVRRTGEAFDAVETVAEIRASRG